MSFDFSDFPPLDGSSSPSSSSSSSSSSSCQLSPHDKFFSSLLTSAIGSIVTGISAGWLIAFCTAWICWLATTRILVVGLIYSYQAIRGRNLEGGVDFLLKIPLLKKSARIQQAARIQHQERGRYEQVAPPPYEETIELQRTRSTIPFPEDRIDAALLNGDAEANRGRLRLDTSGAMKLPVNTAAEKRMRGFEKTPPTVLGWIGWGYATLYFPVVQILWLISNFPQSPSSGMAKLVRAIAISVTALPLTMDTKARYAVSLTSKYGTWAGRTFTLIHALTTLLLSILSTIMLITAVLQSSIPVFLIPAYIIFSIIWMFGSFVLFPPVDGGNPPNSIGTFAAGLAMGIFGAAFTSAPSFGAMMSAPSEPGVGLSEYLQCESVAVWEKFVAIFP